jgi:hypothetical protein
MSSTQWPVELVRVTDTPGRLLLHFPVLRGWHSALRLAGVGATMLLLALYAAIAYSPAAKPDAATLLTLALTAAVVYPVIAFGVVFVLVAVFAVAKSLTVEVDATSIRCVRRVMGFPYRDRSLPAADVTALEAEISVTPRGLGGGTRYGLVAVAAGGRRLIVAEGIPDETMCGSLKRLIAEHAHIIRVDR